MIKLHIKMNGDLGNLIIIKIRKINYLVLVVWQNSLVDPFILKNVLKSH